MRKDDILKLPSMPLAGPSYPAGPYRFVDREYMVITYETDPQTLAMSLPEPLEPIEHSLVHFEWIKGAGRGIHEANPIASVLPGQQQVQKIDVGADDLRLGSRASRIPLRSNIRRRTRRASGARRCGGGEDSGSRVIPVLASV